MNVLFAVGEIVSALIIFLMIVTYRQYKKCREAEEGPLVQRSACDYIDLSPGGVTYF